MVSFRGHRLDGIGCPKKFHHCNLAVLKSDWRLHPLPEFEKLCFQPSVKPIDSQPVSLIRDGGVQAVIQDRTAIELYDCIIVVLNVNLGIIDAFSRIMIGITTCCIP